MVARRAGCDLVGGGGIGCGMSRGRDGGGVDDVNLQKIAGTLKQSCPILPQLKYISYENKAMY